MKFYELYEITHDNSGYPGYRAKWFMLEKNRYDTLNFDCEILKNNILNELLNYYSIDKIKIESELFNVSEGKVIYYISTIEHWSDGSFINRFAIIEREVK